jgi:Domain of unknown function (DUF5123)/Domain of unknown function (DUF4957)
MKKQQIIAILLISLMAACKKVDDLGEAPRLFRPVVKDGLESNGNWVKASWQPITGSSSYTAEISVDSFRTVIARAQIDSSTYVFQNLQWEKLYQVRVRANAQDTSRSSKFAELGQIRTARFPSILNIPTVSEINDNSVKVSWVPNGDAVSQVRILLASDSSVVATVNLTAADVTNKFRVVTGLKATTDYIIYLFSGTTARGWANFRTKASLSGTIIDLRSVTGNVNILRDTVPKIPAGSIVLLKRGERYEINSTVMINKTLTFMAGDDLLNPDKPLIYMPQNFNITDGSMIDSIVFNDVRLEGSSYSSKYVFNINTNCNIGKLKFENCTASIFRGILRTQSKPALFGTLEMNNCIVDSISNYGVFNIDVATSKADNIKITNSTIYRAERIITSRNNSLSVLVENCTFNQAPMGNSSSYYVDYSTASSNNVTNGITINNCILGIGKNSNGAFTVRGIRCNAATVINASNNYRTSDHVSAGNDFPNIITYAKASTALWQNPMIGQFKIIDNTFAGRNTSGDPRWRP